MNKLLIVAVLAAVAGFVSPASAASVANPQNGRFSIPQDKNSGTPDVNRRWSAPSICKVSKSLTCVVCASAGNEGILVDIEVSSGAVGGYVVALDTGALPSAGREPAASGAGQQIASQRTCEYTVATTGLSTGDCGRKQFPDGRPFTRGLTLCASTADTEVTATYRILQNP